MLSNNDRYYSRSMYLSIPAPPGAKSLSIVIGGGPLLDIEWERPRRAFTNEHDWLTSPR